VQIVLDGAGHMGPITHGQLVADVIARHLPGRPATGEIAEAA
jgi:hypothetical protein